MSVTFLICNYILTTIIGLLVLRSSLDARYLSVLLLNRGQLHRCSPLFPSFKSLLFRLLSIVLQRFILYLFLKQFVHSASEFFVCDDPISVLIELSDHLTPKVLIDRQLATALKVGRAEPPLYLIDGDLAITIQIHRIERHLELLLVQQSSLVCSPCQKFGITNQAVIVLVQDRENFSPVHLTAHNRLEFILQHSRRDSFHLFARQVPILILIDSDKLPSQFHLVSFILLEADKEAYYARLELA